MGAVVKMQSSLKQLVELRQLNYLTESDNKSSKNIFKIHLKKTNHWILCTFDKCHQKHAACSFKGLFFSAHTRWLHYSLWDKHFGPISQRTWGLRVQTPWKARKEVQHNEHKYTSISLIHDANWSWDNRVLWERLEAHFTKVKLHRPMRWEARNTTALKKNTLSLVQIHTLALSMLWTEDRRAKTPKHRLHHTLTLSKWHGQTRLWPRP